MTELTNERLEKRIKNCIEIGNGCVMLPVSVAEELLAYRKAAENPIGSFHISGGQVEATTDYCGDGEWPVQDGEVLVYASPVLPKQPEPRNEVIAKGVESGAEHFRNRARCARVLGHHDRACFLDTTAEMFVGYAESLRKGELDG